MASDLLAREADYAIRYPNKRVIYTQGRRLPMFLQYMVDWKAAQTQDVGAVAAERLRPSVIALYPDGRVFVEINAHGFYGPEIDFTRKLVAIWGDSVVEGWGPGWINGLSERFPGFQILNGGITKLAIPLVGMRAIEMNRRLPIAYNIVFPGVNTTALPIPCVRTLYAWLHRLCSTLPNVILCTQPTSLNEDLLEVDLASHLAQMGRLDYRAGYVFWHTIPGTRQNVNDFWHLLRAQNAVVWRVAEEQQRLYGRHIPVVDLYTRFYTGGQPDFRDHFVDAMHFRVEATPHVQEVFHAEFVSLLK